MDRIIISIITVYCQHNLLRHPNKKRANQLYEAISLRMYYRKYKGFDKPNPYEKRTNAENIYDTFKRFVFIGQY